jgi:flagellin
LRIDLSTSLGLLKNLNVSGSKSTKSLERLSSGKQVNHASDNPSGMTQIGYAKGQIGGLKSANQSLQDAYNYLQIRAAAMNEVRDCILRIRDLAVRAASDATMTNAQRQLCQNEAGVLASTISNIDTNTKFQQSKIFDISPSTVPGGASGPLVHAGQTSISIDLAANTIAGVVTINAAWFNGAASFPDMNIISPDGTEAFGYLYQAHEVVPPGTVETYLSGGGGAPNALSVNAGAADGKGLGTMGSATKVEYSGWSGYVGTGGWDEEDFRITNPMAGNWTIIIDNEQALPKNFAIFINTPAQNPTPHDTVMATANNVDVNGEFHLGQFQVAPTALGVSSSMNTVANAQATISSSDNALKTLATHMNDDGVTMRSLEQYINENNVQIRGMDGIRSRIEDADMANEITALTRSQIVSSAAANLMSANISSLQRAADTLLSSI